MAASLLSICTVSAQVTADTEASAATDSIPVADEEVVAGVFSDFDISGDTIIPIVYESVYDSLMQNAVVVDTVVNVQPLPKTFFLPPVFTSYNVEIENDAFKSQYSGTPALRWLEDANALSQRQQDIMQHAIMQYPYAVKYNIGMLPEAPKKYDVVINPEDYTVKVIEIDNTAPIQTTVVADEINKRHWLRSFTGNLQFSQAYISPNWYQGGNNNLNILLDLNYNVKLNQKFHPKLLFETNVQYKLGLYSTPDDSIRAYSISTDIFQVNSTFGLKAANKWYYTVTGMFKTQLFNSYPINSRNLKSALLSPGELNIGLGMTYNTQNARKTVKFDASLSPLSYDMMMCINSDLNETAFGIEEGKKVKSQYGSSMECKLSWQIASNISLASRLFGFTDYDRAYADLENTLVFTINKYLTTQLYVHMRYDTTTPRVDDWHKLQIKEILSLGFTYKFSTI